MASPTPEHDGGVERARRADALARVVAAAAAIDRARSAAAERIGAAMRKAEDKRAAIQQRAQRQLDDVAARLDAVTVTEREAVGRRECEAGCAVGEAMEVFRSTGVVGVGPRQIAQWAFRTEADVKAWLLASRDAPDSGAEAAAVAEVETRAAVSDSWPVDEPDEP